jgi:uncharacterized HAD superfamily protein
LFLSKASEALMAMTMNLGFDIDGVISNFTARFVDVIRKRYGATLTDADMYSYDISLVLGITKDEVADIVNETVKSDLPLNPLAKETLDMLNAEGHKIYLLTARSDELFEHTLDWLKRKGIVYKDIFHLTSGKKNLVDVSIDLAVEDNLEEAIELTRKVKHVLLFDQPWNKTKNVKGLVKRVYSWSEVYEEVQKVAASL